AVSATARFCKGCGSPLDGEALPAAEGPTRKIVTVLFADLAGSTAFEEIVDAETAREVIGRYHELLRSTVERHRVGVTKYIGDGFMAVWGVPEIGADDAGRAVDAAVELQERFVGLARDVAEAHEVELALRVAVNTGEVVVGADDADLVGDALNVGARLESECPHGQVVVGEETWRSTRGRHRYETLGAVRVKGRQAAVPVYQWLGSAAAEAITFVGRGDELQRLRRVFDNAVAARGARLVTVTGDPGVGKTRLAAELARSLPGARVLDVRCAVEGSPALAPIVEVLRPRDLEAEIPAGTAERDRMLRDLTGMTSGVPGSVEETFWALRRFVEVLAAGDPLVLIFDDIQWADSLLLDFIEHLAEWVRGAPVLMIALARPELRETRPDLVTVGGWVTEAVRLRGLEAGATAELAGRVLGSDRLPEELLRRLPTSTGGNPLFVRELVGMLVHDGVLAPKPHGWRLTVDAADIDVPPTIQALLASRLERLKPADRRVLEVASVIGTDFAASAVAELTGLRDAEVIAVLNRLRRLDLAEPSGAYAGDAAVWRFHHVLIRDVAYRRLLKSERADLHERLANWVEAGGTNLAFESDEVVARNLEAAQGYRSDLGLRDTHSAELALRSARSYLSSARRALDRDELVSAGTQAARGAALATADTALHAGLLLVGCEAFLSAGDVAAGAPLVDDLERIAGDALAPWAICYRCQLVVYTDPSRLPEADDRLQEAIDEFARRGDAAGLAKAHRVRANARARLGRVGDAEIDLFEALIAARRGGDHRQITAALGAAPNAALWGPSPAPKAGGRCLDVVRMQRMTTAAPSLEATSLRCLAVLELLRGRPDKARSMLGDARQVVAELGLRHGLMETELYAGIIELMVGDPVAAEPHFRTALEGLDALGVGADAGQAAALLARSVLAQGRIDEADRYAAESERIAGHNLKTAIGWRAVRAEILSAQGQHEAAIAKAREAVAVAADTDLVLDHADACLALSRVLAAAGDASAAAHARSDAESLYAAKDAVFMVSRAALAVSAEVDPPTVRVTHGSRLVVRNRASEVAEAGWRALEAHDVEAVAATFSDQAVYDDRRSIGGAPLAGAGWPRKAAERAIADYPHAAWQTLAVRGDTLALLRGRLWDDAGNESITLNVHELAADGLVGYHGRFDGDDFEGACREMEALYYAGEGAAFAENGRAASAWIEAMWRCDVEAARRASWPDFRWLASPSSLKPEERSVDEFFDWLGERKRQLSAMPMWMATIHWISTDCFVGLTEIQGVGADGEEYDWGRIYVGEYRIGRAVSVREFAVEEEDTAFAYAESLAQQRRLVVANAASRAIDRAMAGLQANDAAAVNSLFSVEIVYEDRRPVAGALITGIEYLTETVAALVAQYDHFAGHPVAVRGDRICLAQSRWSDEAGNESSNLHVIELGNDGLIARMLYCADDDFDGAYQQMEAWYYAGEGRPYAEHGRTQSAFVEAMNNLDGAAIRRLCRPEFRWLSLPSTLTAPARTVDELIEWWRERVEQAGSVRQWNSAIAWLSPDVWVGTGDARGLSTDGAEYTWSGIYVGTFADGLVESVGEFDDEDAAFVYAESLVAQEQRRLVVANAASRVSDRLLAAFQAKDIAAAMHEFSADIAYEERRAFAGGLVVGIDYLRESVPALLAQYNHFEGHTLAARGDRLCLVESRWWDDSGNTAANLHVGELGEDGRLSCLLYFDGDDFTSAYQELDARYYAGEGAAYADPGRAQSAFVAAVDHLDAEAARQLCRPEFRWLSPTSALVDPVRTIDEVISWFRDRAGQVDSLRNWTSAITWMSPEVAVNAGEARGISRDGAGYSWSGLYVSVFRDGLFESIRGFEPDDEEAAFVYAESLVKRRGSRLAVANAASRALEQAFAALRAKDASVVASLFSAAIVYEDRRPLAGALEAGVDYLNEVVPALLSQYDRFETRILAVRGDRLCLGWSRWSDESGNEATNLHVTELGEDGLITRLLYFVGDDFWGAYRELEERYYAGEGAAFAVGGRAAADWVGAISNGDIGGVRRASHPDFRWYATPSALKDAERNVDDMFRWWQERGRQVSSQRHWVPAMVWLSPDCAVGRTEIAAVGQDGEQYSWNSTYVSEFRDGQLLTVREFDDEDSAFAYAESVVTPKSSRLSLMNGPSRMAYRVLAALRNGDLDTIIEAYADDYVHADHRRLGGEPITDRASMRDAFEQIVRLYNRFEIDIIAARGERLHLLRHRWSDDSGNQSIALILNETDESERIVFQDRFDEDDFAAAYAELDRLYYANEGAPYAEEGLPLVANLHAENLGDLDGAFRIFSAPGLRIESRSRSVFPTRTADELRRSVEELGAMVTSYRVWSPAACWLSPNWIVARHEREAVGFNGEKLAWSRLWAGETHGGRFTSLCEFDVDDEEAAFAYAEERMRAAASRLPLSNRASRIVDKGFDAMRTNDATATLELRSQALVYDDRRHISGGLIGGIDDLGAGLAVLLTQYQQFENHSLVVRGDRLCLAWSRWQDDTGNEAIHLHVIELGEDGLISYEGRFDEDDFEAAYMELERRYYAGEGAAFATEGSALTEIVLAENRGDLDGAFSVYLRPGLEIENRSRSVFPTRTAAELRRSVEELGAMVTSYRVWSPALRWLSPNWVVARHEREAVGSNGETLTWSRLYAGEIRGGIFATLCEFDIDDEESAFAYAEDRMRAASGRLGRRNQASELGFDYLGAVRAGDVDAIVAMYSEQFVYEDRRRLAGDPIVGVAGVRAAITRLRKQFTRFDLHSLAFRGDRLHLTQQCWSDESGNESRGLGLVELDESGRVSYHGVFDEDDFDSAYRELERRYYAGEGEAFAQNGLFAADYVATMNRGDFDTMFNELSSADFRFQNRGRSPFPDRSARELRASFEDLYARLASVRSWFSSLRWVSPTISVGRLEREAVGHDGTQFAWTRVLVNTYRDGRLASIWEFDEDDEAAALAFAEETFRSAQGRLTVRNRATAAAERVTAALGAGDVEALVSCVSENYFLDDRRHFSGDPLRGHESLRAGTERVLRHFKRFEMSPLAVRGERFALCLLRWSDGSGNESTHLHVIEVGDDDRIAYEVRFDEDGFEGAYRELEERYYAGEGAESAQPGMVIAKYTETLSRGDLDTLFSQVCTPDVRVESRSRSVFLDRSATELRSSLEELQRLVGTTRNWFAAIRWISPRWAVGLYQREAVGDAGEQYEWNRIVVGEIAGRRLAYACQFEMEDEDAAFAYAEERARASANPLAVANRASALFASMIRTMDAGDIEAVLTHAAEDYVLDDRRLLSGDPIVGKAALRPAVERILEQFNGFESRLLAVRGENLALVWSRWSDDADSQTSYLHVWELNDDGHVARDIRFDEDDFEGAYGELESRYYGELGDEFEAQGKLAAEYVLAANRGDFDTLFGELSSPDLRVKNLSRSFFPDRTAEELRASYEELYAMVPTVRSWFSVGRWMSPTVYIGRLEREGVGRDGERYTWSRILVNEYLDGRAASMCEFDAGDDAAALAYAEELAAQT
ncbi:MAG: hypothetical protein E6Q57_14015, partial [Mycobacterium sp.]